MKAYKFLLLKEYRQGTNNLNFLDLNSALNERKFAGYVFMQMVNKPDNISTAYTLNGMDDTWFRNIEHGSNSYGYGLAITKLSISKISPKEMGDYNCFKCNIMYIPWEDSEEQIPVRSSAVLWVHLDADLNKVLHYIQSNIHKWRP